MISLLLIYLKCLILQLVYQFFFYVLIFSLNIVLLNLITGLIINNYRTIKENIANFQQLNEFQRQWIQMMQIMQKKKLIYLIPKPSSKYRLICYHLASNQYFETVILILLVVNLIFCSSYSGKQSITTQEALYGMSIFFIVIFHVELFIKLLAYWVHFFRDILNKFDIIILIVTDVLLIMKDSFDLPRLYTIPLIIRSLRIIKANKLFRFNKQLRVLIDVIQDLIPTLLSVIVFIAITIIIYSLIGVQTFSTVWSTSSDPQYPYTMEESQRTKSFSNFLDGVLILIDISTGQYWSLYCWSLIFNCGINGINLQNDNIWLIIQLIPKDVMPKLLNNLNRKVLGGVVQSLVIFSLLAFWF